MERMRYDIMEGESVQFCANLTGHIERDLDIDVTLIEGTATGESIHPFTCTPARPSLDSYLSLLTTSAAFSFANEAQRNGDVTVPIDDITFEVPRGSGGRSCLPSCTACTQVRTREDTSLETQFEDCQIALSHDDTANVIIDSSRSTLIIEDNDGESL